MKWPDIWAQTPLPSMRWATAPSKRPGGRTVQTVEEYLEINSPYNTYLYPGLPPGPIASPGIASIEAALNPAETLYCYFVASSGGAHVFAQTGAEHQFNVQTYQQR